MDHNNPYGAPMEVDVGPRPSWPRPRAWLVASLMACVPFAYGCYLVLPSLIEKPPPAGQGSCGMAALGGLFLIAVIAPATWIGSYITCRSLGWLTSWRCGHQIALPESQRNSLPGESPDLEIGDRRRPGKDS